MRKFPTIKSEESHTPVSESLGRLVKNKNYIFSVVAQFFYVAAQIGIWTFIIPYVMASGAGYDKADDAWWFYFYSLCGFLITRFVYTALMKKFDPARLLSVGMSLAIFFTLCTIFGSGTFVKL